MKTFVCDIETDGLLEEVTKIHCLVILEGDIVHTFTHANIEDGIRKLNEADLLVFQNGLDYDIRVMQRLYPHIKINTKVVDTLVLSRVLFSDLTVNDVAAKYCETLREHKLLGSHSLKAWGIRLGDYKGESPIDWSTFTLQMLTYCIQDTKVTQKLYNHFLSLELDPRCSELEHQFAKICRDVSETGVSFDTEMANQLANEWCERVKTYELSLSRLFPPRIEETKAPSYYFVLLNGERYQAQFKGALTDEVMAMNLPGITRGYLKDNIKQGPPTRKEIPFNPRSGIQVAERLIEKYGWIPEKKTPAGLAATTGDVLSKLPYEGAKILGEFKDLVKIYGMVKDGDQAWLNHVKEDDVVYGRINSNGTMTGRCTHSKPNLAQVPKGGYLGEQCRSLFIPRKGMKLVGWDAKALEMRCLAHYLAEFDDGAYCKVVLEGDPHEFNRVAAGLETRDQAKTFFYALIYGAGDKKIGSIIGGNDWAGAQIKDKYFAAMPAFTKLLAKVQDEAKRTGHVIGLDGRRLPIRATYAALNTLLQSAGAVVMKRAVVEQELELRRLFIRGVDYNTLLLVHDEVQLEITDGMLPKILPRLETYLPKAGEYFNFKCPLAADVSDPGENWKETH